MQTLATVAMSIILTHKDNRAFNKFVLVVGAPCDETERVCKSPSRRSARMLKCSQQGVDYMSNVARKWWLGAALLACLVPSSFAFQKIKDDPGHDTCKPGDKCRQNVPEGGSAAIYLLGAGLTCLGAMYIRSRSSKPKLS